MVASAWIYAYTHESDNKEVRERLQQQAMIMATDIRKLNRTKITHSSLYQPGWLYH